MGKINNTFNLKIIFDFFSSAFDFGKIFNCVDKNLSVDIKSSEDGMGQKNIVNLMVVNTIGDEQLRIYEKRNFSVANLDFFSSIIR